MTSRDPESKAYRSGIGNWSAFDLPVERVFAAAEEWKKQIGEAERLWLCWNVDPDWCLLQQRLVAAVGWTPLVGFDPRVGPPPALPQAIVIDFNKRFGLPTLYFHFPLEFMFLYADRLAFWHSDLLCRLDKMRRLADRFAAVPDGEMAAVYSRQGGLRGLVDRKSHRYWELIGCTTRGASKSQFDNACGWWMHFENHISRKDEAERQRLSAYYWEHGVGIMYWARHCGGKVHDIDERFVEEGHFSEIKSSDYHRASPKDHRKNLNLDLRANFRLADCARKLGIEQFL